MRHPPFDTKRSKKRTKKEVKQDDEIDNVAAGESPSGDLSNAMAAYAAAISKTKDIKLSNK